MTEPTTDAEDFADYTDEQQTKPPPDRETVERSRTPDVAEEPTTEPPD